MQHTTPTEESDVVLGDDGNPVLVDVPAELEPTRPPLIDEHGRVRLSFSRIESYEICPRRFRYGYIDKLPGKPAPNLSFGTSVHDALERFYDRKLPVEPTEDELVGFLYDAWDTSGFAGMDREEQKVWYRHGQDVLRRYHRKVAGRYKLPVATEAWFELPFEDAVVVGSIDRVDADEDGALHVVDYKTSKKVKSRDRVAKSLQLSIYALACEHLYGELPATVSLDFVVPGVEVVVTLDELDLDAAREAISRTAAAVKAEQFDPRPTRMCDWCDFTAVCPAWEGDGEETFANAVIERDALRRRIARQLSDLRALEAGVDRLREEMDARPEPDVADLAPVPPTEDGTEDDEG